MIRLSCCFNFLRYASLMYLWISVLASSHKSHSEIGTGHLCDPQTETVRKNPDNPTQYFKCEPKRLKNGTRIHYPVGEWVAHECLLKTIEECLSDETPNIKKSAVLGKIDKPSADSVGASADAAVADYDYYNAIIFQNPLIPAVPEKRCRMSSAPSPGATCCLSQSAEVLEADPTNVRYYLQCNPSQEGADFGVWIRMECPFGTGFNAGSQSCGPNFAHLPVSSQSSNITSLAGTSIVSPSEFPTCPDGKKTNLFCNGEYCPKDYDCVNGGCCPKKQAFAVEATIPSKILCPDGSTAYWTCQFDAECSDSYACTRIADKSYCCRSSARSRIRNQFIGYQTANCPGSISPAVSITICSTGTQCPTGFFCPYTSGICCPQNQNCPDGTQAVGPCINGQCGVGFTCLNNLCCRSRTCPDGSSALTTSCTLDSQCPPSYYCPTSVGFCCLQTATTVTAAQNCPDGTAAVGSCINGQCGPGFACNTATNLCCTATNQLCTGGTQPAGACIGGLCGVGFTCDTTLNLCCSTTGAQASRCLDGTTPSGPCVNGLCGVNFVCTTGNLCCPTGGTVVTSNQCADGSTPVGACINGLCAVGFACSPAGFCCSTGGTVTTTITCPTTGLPATERCTAALGCLTANFICVDGVNCCPNPNSGTSCAASVALGPCISGLCPANAVCLQNQCCPTGGGRFTDIDAYPSYPKPSYPDNEITCRNGQYPVAACRNGLCHSGYTCQIEDNFCCPVTPKISITSGIGGLRPGAKCSRSYSQECNGASKGLAACLSGICTCLPPAIRSGNTCYLQPKANFVPRGRGPYYSQRSVLVGLMNDDGGHVTNSSEPEVVLSRNCSQMSDCDAQAHEQCINGECISPKGPGDRCDDKLQCTLNCPASDCVENSEGVKVCVCAEKLYKYGRRCMKKCPQGTRSRTERKDCEDTLYSRMLRDTPLFEKEMKSKSAC